MYANSRYFGRKLKLFWFLSFFFYFDKVEIAYFKYFDFFFKSYLKIHKCGTFFAPNFKFFSFVHGLQKRMVRKLRAFNY